MNPLARKWGGYHAEPTFTGRISFRQVRIDRGGYDPQGRYYGGGAPVYHVESECGGVDFYIRAGDRAGALSVIVKGYPHAKVRK